MLQLFDILVQLLAFGVVFVGVLLAQRTFVAALTVRRRMGDRIGATAQTGEGGILRSDAVENRFLAWVQSALLTDTADRSKLRRDLALAGFE